VHLDYVVAAAGRRPGIAVCSSNCALLEQSHQLPHGVRDHHLGISLDKNIQFRVFSSLRFFTRSIKATLGSDGCPRGFQDFGDVRTIGDGPSSFLCSSVSI